MADFTLVDPKGWEYDLHSIYSAYIGYFQAHNVPWFDRTWGHLFTSFEDFLAFSWPTITVTDAYTGRAHIVTRLNSIGAFLKMIKTRFGETLPQAPNILLVTPFEVSSRHLRNISDYSTYKKLYSTLPAAVTAAQRVRVRAGDSQTIKELWSKRDKTFLTLSFVWSERNEKSCLEFGYAAVRCGHMEASGHWPPIPDKNYRKGHYIVEEYVDKVINKYPPNQPWQYAFGESQLAPKTKLPQIIQAVISSLTSPESETSSNSIVLIGYGTHAQLARLEDMKIKLPHNVLVIDMATFERSLYATGARSVMSDPKNDRPRTSSCMLNLEGLLRNLHQPQSHCTSVSTNNSSSGLSSSATPRLSPSVIIPQCSLVNSGNEAFMMLFAFQMLLDPLGTRIPTVRKGVLGSQTQGQVLAMANMDTIQAMNMRRPLGMGMPGMLTQGISPMPMYGVSTVPTVVVDGVSAPIATSVSPQLTQIPNHNKGNSQKVKADSGSRKVHRAASAFDLSGESSQLQESMKRINSSGPTRSSNSAPPLLVPVGQQQKESEQGTTGTGVGSLWDRKSSPLGFGERHRRNSSLLR